MSNIDTLVDDIYRLLSEGTEISDEQAEKFGKSMSKMIQQRLKPREDRDFTLRMSSIGKPVNQLWYEAHGYPKEELKPHTLMKFLYGDMVEELALFLTEVSGHKVTDKQKQCEVDGVKGHMDCKIDDVVIDVKSCSHRGFDKFKYNKLRTDDPFGYLAQISGYTHAENGDKGGFLAIDKDQGHICISMYDKKEMIDVPNSIKYIKNVLEQDTPPSNAFCCDIKEEKNAKGVKNGNKYLGAKCSYCPFKKHCHEGLRTFIYSTGPRYFTEIKKEPRVQEITSE
jgi:CRISPR/Cas system-associated exonuclease Cas4 (RecB family)